MSMILLSTLESEELTSLDFQSSEDIQHLLNEGNPVIFNVKLNSKENLLTEAINANSYIYLSSENLQIISSAIITNNQ